MVIAVLEREAAAGASDQGAEPEKANTPRPIFFIETL